ncbi:hypothetical protein GE09DRAFT_1057446 [Coniochaeta sp. 2T2.1]|nr:hypothetical protein GE09DRAFT_1057446 [Coniochaeta sp. 2T2.1]
MSDSKEPRTNQKEMSHNAGVNELLADDIQKEIGFKIRRIPENFVLRFQVVNVVLLAFEITLIISNNVHSLGFWASFVATSTRYREAVKETRLIHAIYPAALDPYHLWRGWIVPSALAGAGYITMSLLCLRHELYHWKPGLLQHYFETVETSTLGRLIPRSWLKYCFHIYERKHQAYVAKHIQRRKHVALEDSAQFLRIVRVVTSNLLISVLALLVWWLLLLRTKIAADDHLTLPRSYVPPLQGLAWYLCNDFFYFYPHWIAHRIPSDDAFYARYLPKAIARRLHNLLRQAHKQHHRAKANLGIAAWYCSPSEQLCFNLFPALIGPLITQMVANAFGVEEIWGTRLVTMYVWVTAAAVSSVLAHTGYRSVWNDPGKHDLHHERAFDPKAACNFGTMGFFDWLHGTKSAIPAADALAWRSQRDRQAALWEASRRSGIPLSKEQMEVVKQPDHSTEWVEKEM